MASRNPKRPRIVEEPVFIEKDGESQPYVPMEIKTARDAYAASLHMLFKHIADIHVTIVEIIAEKYKLDEEEIFKCIKTDPRYTNMDVDPKLHGMGYLKESDGAAGAAAAAVAPDDMFEASDTEVNKIVAGVGAMNLGTFAAPAPAAVKKKVIKPRAKKAAAAPTGSSGGGAASS
jgi:hypothetical protein